uniref:Tc1-like transposase DDE domain-containing protein n=1 Tax=Oreochromis aureus TaxID=47969 RepID=A0A668RX01_OREAU
WQFYIAHAVLLVDFLPVGTTINADRYCETLEKLRRAFQNRRRGMLRKGVSILHDTARPYVARHSVALQQNFDCNFITHPPYSLQGDSATCLQKCIDQNGDYVGI